MTSPPCLSAVDYVRIRVAGMALDLAKEKRRRLDTEAARLEDEAARALGDALRAAGYDPTKRWRFHDDTLRLEEVTDGHPDRNR